MKCTGEIQNAQVLLTVVGPGTSNVVETDQKLGVGTVHGGRCDFGVDVSVFV